MKKIIQHSIFALKCKIIGYSINNVYSNKKFTYIKIIHFWIFSVYTNAENNIPIGGGDMPNIQNINDGNANVIRIETMHIWEDNQNQEDNGENPNLLNNLIWNNRQKNFKSLNNLNICLLKLF